jgi:hypothetical protein
MYGPSSAVFTAATFGYSGNYVIWDVSNGVYTGGIGHTSVGTLAGSFFLYREGTWEVNYSLQATGVPSGKSLESFWRLSSNGSITGGTAVDPSYVISEIVAATTVSRKYVSKSFMMQVASGIAAQLFVRVGGSGAANQGGILSATGTDVTFKYVG